MHDICRKPHASFLRPILTFGSTTPYRRSAGIRWLGTHELASRLVLSHDHAAVADVANAAALE